MNNKPLLILLSLGAFALISYILGLFLGWVGILIAAAIFITICGIQLIGTIKLLNTINQAPEGLTPNATQLHQHIHIGMPLLSIVKIAKALGQKTATSPETYTWQDQTHRVTVTFNNQKAETIELTERTKATLKENT